MTSLGEILSIPVDFFAPFNSCRHCEIELLSHLLGTFHGIIEKHAPLKKKTLRDNHAHFQCLERKYILEVDYEIITGKALLCRTSSVQKSKQQMWVSAEKEMH